MDVHLKVQSTPSQTSRFSVVGLFPITTYKNLTTLLLRIRRFGYRHLGTVCYVGGQSEMKTTSPFRLSPLFSRVLRSQFMLS